LGVKLARKFSGEIISADSRQIYRGLDIGTAKPSRQVGLIREQSPTTSLILKIRINLILPLNTKEIA